MKLTDTDLAKIEDKKLANILRKIQEGKTPTAREEVILARARSADAASGSTAPAVQVNSGYAKNWDELATALGVSRRAITMWKADPRYNTRFPKDKADGRKEVAAWLEFMRENGLARADQRVGEVPTDEDDGLPLPVGMKFPPGSESQWKKKLLEQKVTIAEIEASKLKGLLIVGSDLEIPLGATFVAIQNALNQYPERTAPLVAGFTDVHEITEIMRGEMEANLSGLNGASYLDEVEAIAAALPIATAATRALVIEATSEVLRRIGRAAIANALRVAVPPADPLTGQMDDESAEEHARKRAQPEKPSRKKTTRRRK